MKNYGGVDAERYIMMDELKCQNFTNIFRLANLMRKSITYYGNYIYSKERRSWYELLRILLRNLLVKKVLLLAEVNLK